jgi:hypothetical protein
MEGRKAGMEGRKEGGNGRKEGRWEWILRKEVEGSERGRIDHLGRNNNI